MDLATLVDAFSFNQYPIILIVDKRLLKNLRKYFNRTPVRRTIRESFHPIHPMHPILPIHPFHPIHPIHPIHPLHLEAPPRRPLRYVCPSEQPVEIPSLSLFKKEYHRLELKKLLCVQYSINYEERKFLLGGICPKYSCNLCGYEVGIDLKTHLNGIIHSVRLQLVTEMYDPRNAIWLHGIPEIENEQRIKNSSLSLFKTEYHRLQLDKLVFVQYSINNGERKFLIEGADNKYRCNLCCSKVGIASNLKNHFYDITHFKRLQFLTEMYDPINAIWLTSLMETKKEETLDNNQQEKILANMNHEMALENKQRKQPLENKRNNEEIVSSSLLLNMFKKNYFHLEDDKLLNVQYSFNFKDRKFMVVLYHGCLCCDMCGCLPSTITDLRSHLKGEIHSKRVDNAVEMYDPLNRVWLQSTIKGDKNFKTIYVDLKIREILDIEYQENCNEWEHMFSIKSDRIFCNLCGGVCIGSIHNVKSHVHGRYHSALVKDLTDLYHPKHWNDDESKKDVKASEGSREESVSIHEEKLLENKQKKSEDNERQEQKGTIKHQGKTHENNQPNKELNPLSLRVFKSNYFNLAYEKLLNVQYSFNYKDRKYMVVDEKPLLCTMCGCNLSGSTKNLREHLRGARHSMHIYKAVEMYDPMKCVWLRSTQIEQEVKDDKTTENPAPLSVNEVKDDKTTENPAPLSVNALAVENNFHNPPSLLNFFKIEYRQLELANLLNVQFSINDEKKFMIEHVNGQYECKLCCCKLDSASRLKNHFNEVIHTQRVEYLKEMYDPINCIWLKDKQKEENLLMPSNVEIKNYLSERKIQYDEFKIKCSTSCVVGFQYKLNDCDEWLDVLSQHAAYFFCNFCNANKKPFRSLMTLFSHIKSMSHWDNVPKTAEVFHPEYCLQSLSRDTNQTTISSKNPIQAFDKQQKSHLETKKHNLDEFKKFYVNLPIEELLEVQYQIKNEEWEFLLDQSNQHYYCRLCQNVELAHEKSVQDHIRSLYHSINVNQLSAMYHPIYCVCWDIKSSSNDEFRWGLYERNDFKIHSHNADVDIVLEEFKQNYIDLNLDELLNVQYQFNDNDWEFMFTELYDGYYCNLCEIILQDFEHNVDIHILGKQHLDNIKNLTALYHPEYCTFESGDYLEENENGTNILYDDEFPDPILRQFTMDYVNLNTDEITQIAYEMIENSDWEYMINVKNKQFFCNLCGKISLETNEEMERHIREEKHINKVKSVLGLYHPTYCFADMDENEDSESIFSTCSELPDESMNCIPFNIEKTGNSLKCASRDLLVLPKELSSNASSGSQSDILVYEELDTLSTDDEFFHKHSILDESTTSDDI